MTNKIYKNAAVFGAGQQDKTDIVLPEDCLVLAADGGCDYCKKLGIVPDIRIGDFDSLGYCPEQAICLPAEKDITDTDAAVALALKHGCSTVFLYGCTGGRLDHTLANLSLIGRLSQQGIRAFLCDKEYTVTAVTNGTLHFDDTHTGTVSIFAFDGKAEGVTLCGLKYTLQNGTLRENFALGVSNEFTGVPAEITVKNGTLLVLYR